MTGGDGDKMFCQFDTCSFSKPSVILVHDKQGLNIFLLGKVLAK